jgi:hypothetical protein
LVSRLSQSLRAMKVPVRFLVRRADTLGPSVRLGWGAFAAHFLVTTANTHTGG